MKNKIKLFVVTCSRSEYGLMRPFLFRALNDKNIDCKLIVSGTHLRKEYGNTYKEIENDGINIYKKIEIINNKNIDDISLIMSEALKKFSKFLLTEKPDMVFLDGDRYETLAIAISAYNNRIPIIHNGGGCVTKSALDDNYRHAITKMSSLHFTSLEKYRKRIIQLGENPKNIFAVGSLGIENILKNKLLSIDELEESLRLNLKRKYIIATYHPETTRKANVKNEIDILVRTLLKHKDLFIIFTKSNADEGGQIINSYLEKIEKMNNNICVFDSLGTIKYLSLVKNSQFVIGNSSSGIIEAPSFKIPTINIGERQKGRELSDTIINCKMTELSIEKAIKKANSKKFRNICLHSKNINGDGKTSIKMINNIIKYYKKNNKEKEFYDVF